MIEKNVDEKYSFETSDLKLASLILSHLHHMDIEIISPINSEYSIIKVFYKCSETSQVQKLFQDYLERRATVNLWEFNRTLKQLRDRVKGVRSCQN